MPMPWSPSRLFLALLLPSVFACGGGSDRNGEAPIDTADAADTAPDAVGVSDAEQDTRSVPGVPGLDEVVASSELPGVVAGMASGTELLALGVSGVRQVGEGALVEVGDAFHIGSNTKAMTATLVARLVERGVLTWDATIAELFPDLEVHAGYDAVTVRDLLSHVGRMTDSLPNTLGQQAWLGFFMDSRSMEVQRAEVVELLIAEPPSFPAGEFAYSNAGYVIVGAALERLTGESWESLMTTELFEPLEMTGCGFGPPVNANSEAPVGHVAGGGGVEPAPGAPYNDNPAVVGPAGTVSCPAEAWVRFLQAHLRSDDGPFLTEASWDALHAPNAAGYALGWGVADRSWAGGVTYSHSGSNTMWFSVAWIAPGIDRLYFAMTNVATEDTPAVLDGIIGDLIE